MSFSPPSSSSSMAFTFGTHQSTSLLFFCREINASSTLCRKRTLADPSPSGPSRKKRRLRLSLTTSPLSLPFSTPRASFQPDRASNRHRTTTVIILRPSQRLPRPSTSASSSSSSSSSPSCSPLRKAAILNRVQQRMDTACQRNPNLRWEKEQRQERELLLKEGVQMRRMAALKDGLLSPVTSTRPVGSPVGDVVHYSDPRRPPAAARHDVHDRERRCDEDKESAGEPHADAAAASMWFCSKNGYPTPPPSAVGLSNYDALDSEEEKDDAAAPLPSPLQQHHDAATPAPEPAGVVDEGMRDIFDFLTPPATHRSFLSDFGDGEGDDDATRAAPCPSPVPGPGSVHTIDDDDANDADDVEETSSSEDGDEHAGVDAEGRLAHQHARAAPLKPGPHCAFQRCQSASPVSRRPHPHYHHHHQHHHHRRHDCQHHCAMAAAAAAAFVAVPHAY